MKISHSLLALMLLISLCRTHAFAQTDSRDMEAYSRQHLAFTNAQVLGVNKKQYAQCIQSVNFQDPSITHKYVSINGIRYYDDGKNNDLVGNDGILTSEFLYNYKPNEPVLQTGQYKPILTPVTIVDKAFQHNTTTSNGIQSDGFKITCKTKWVKCSDWPANMQSICTTFSWPFTGGMELTECTFEFTWN